MTVLLRGKLSGSGGSGVFLTVLRPGTRGAALDLKSESVMWFLLSAPGGWRRG